jgi:hypothetical protein
LASLVKDYDETGKARNITFIGINMSRTGDARSIAPQVKRYKLGPFANMIDAGGATANAYKVPANAPNWLTVIDSNGQVVYNASKGWKWGGGPNNGKFIHHTEMAAALKKSKGILPLYELPDELKQAAHLYDLQQFHLVLPELKMAKRKAKNNATVDAVSGFMEKKIFSHGKLRRGQLKTLATTKPVQAYREAMAFVKAFPRLDGSSDIKKMARDLAKDKKVKKELYAESVYKRMVVPTMKKCRTPAMFDRKLAPLFKQFMNVYGETEFSGVVKKAVDAHEAAVQRAK